jgi:hypothetical protein
VRNLEVLFNPRNEVILVCSLDCLVEKVRGEKFIYICSRKVGCEWLWSTVSVHLGVDGSNNLLESRGQFHSQTIECHRLQFREVLIIAPVCGAQPLSCRDL